MAYRCGKVGGLRLVVLAGALLASPALAEDEEWDDEPDPARTVFFGSLEAGPSKSFVSYGSKRAVGTDVLDASGFRLMQKVGVASERATRYGRTYKTEAQALLGYEWQLGSTILALYAGSDFEAEYRETRCGCYRGIARLGKRLQAELWATPSSATMAQASAYVSTLDHRAWGRLALGHTLGAGVYLGPEIEFYRQSDYHKLRAGAHLTGLRLFGTSWRLSAGWQAASRSAPGAYATLGVHWTAGLEKQLAGLFVLPLQRRLDIRP